jgi:virulence-associated protein VagC
LEATAKIFKNGRSQAVRLPKEFRFDGDTVKIRKEGKKVVLEPLGNTKWPKKFWKLFTSDPNFDIPRHLLSKPVDLDRH